MTMHEKGASRKDVVVRLRCSEADKRIIEERARMQGLSVSQYLLRLATGSASLTAEPMRLPDVGGLLRRNNAADRATDFEQAIATCGGAGKATVAAVADTAGVCNDTIRRWLRRCPHYTVKYGEIRLVEGAKVPESQPKATASEPTPATNAVKQVAFFLPAKSKALIDVGAAMDHRTLGNFIWHYAVAAAERIIAGAKRQA